MEIKLLGEKKTILIKADSEIDHHSADKIRKAADLKIKSSNAVNVIFDFSRVDFMDSSGIGVIMGRFKMTKLLGGKVIIFGVKKQVSRLLEMAGIDRIVTVCKNLDEAVKKL